MHDAGMPENLAKTVRELYRKSSSAIKVDKKIDHRSFPDETRPEGFYLDQNPSLFIALRSRVSVKESPHVSVYASSHI